MTTLSWDIKISAVFSVVSLQSTRVNDGRTDGQMDRQNYDPQDRASIAASRRKNWNKFCVNNLHILLLDSNESGMNVI